MAKVAEASSVLGPRLRAIRLERGMSLRELARRLDLSPSSISQIETGKMQPSVRTLYAFVAEYGVTVDEVLFEQGAAAARSESARVPARRAGPRSAARRGTSGDRPQLRRHMGAADVLGGRGRRVHRGDVCSPAVRPAHADALVRHNGHEFGHVLSGTSGWSSDSTSSSSARVTRSPFHRRLPTVSATRAMRAVRAIWVVRGRRGAQSSQEIAERGPE